MTGHFELGRNTQNIRLWLWHGLGPRSEKDSIAENGGNFHHNDEKETFQQLGEPAIDSLSVIED